MADTVTVEAYQGHDGRYTLRASLNAWMKSDTTVDLEGAR